jgi:hypothetical protein
MDLINYCLEDWIINPAPLPTTTNLFLLKEDGGFLLQEDGSKLIIGSEII